MLKKITKGTSLVDLLKDKDFLRILDKNQSCKCAEEPIVCRGLTPVIEKDLRDKPEYN